MKYKVYRIDEITYTYEIEADCREEAITFAEEAPKYSTPPELCSRRYEVWKN